MDVFDKKIGHLLLTNKKITPEKLKTLEQQSENEKKPLKDVRTLRRI
jgi:hypothetical protein